jgi:hypothetical protein
MSDRKSILKAIQEEIGMAKAMGKGVQGRTVSGIPKPSENMPSKKINLNAKGSEIGGSQGGETGGNKAAEGGGAMNKANGNGVVNKKAKECGCASGAEHTPSNGDAGTGAKDKEKMTQDGQGVARKEMGSTKNTYGGTKERMDHCGDEGVAEGVMELPHDVLVESDGEQKILPKGTKIVIGEMFDEMGEEEDVGGEEDLDLDGEEDMGEEDMDGEEDMNGEEDMDGEEGMGEEGMGEEGIDFSDPDSISNLLDDIEDGIGEIADAFEREFGEGLEDEDEEDEDEEDEDE